MNAKITSGSHLRLERELAHKRVREEPRGLRAETSGGSGLYRGVMPSDPDRGTPCVAVYERRVAASLERVWENVLDWEHLPWLHSDSFESIESLDAGDWGWRARVTSTQRSRGASLLELRVDRPRGRYVVATLEGAGTGDEIWTGLTPVEVDHTDIRVEFMISGVPAESVAEIGAAYTRLYTQLWDEDEAMMQRREALLSRRGEAPTRLPADPVDLGPRGELRSKLPLEVAIGDETYRVVEVDGEWIAHSTVCPHALGTLGEGEVDGAVIRCPWHGYRFDLRTGRCLDARGLRLAKAPIVVEEAESGRVLLAFESREEARRNEKHRSPE